MKNILLRTVLLSHYGGVLLILRQSTALHDLYGDRDVSKLRLLSYRLDLVLHKFILLK